MVETVHVLEVVGRVWHVWVDLGDRGARCSDLLPFLMRTQMPKLASGIEQKHDPLQHTGRATDALVRTYHREHI